MAGMNKIRVGLKERTYSILMGSGILRDCGALVRKLCIGKDAVVITNARILKLYKRRLSDSLTRSGITVHFELIADSENAKTAGVAVNLIRKINLYDKRREIFIAAFGGGVVGDVAGFVAAVYKRGIPYIQIPTTLLAQVDSSIGGKTAVDIPAAKNIIGAFYQPRLVLSDASLLSSLSARHIKNGLAEVIKYGVIKDAHLFEFLEKNHKRVLARESSALEYIISRSGVIKARLVEEDELDRKGLRAILNYGHTIGHAIEAASHYSDKYNHGEAVAVGMIVAAEIAVVLKIMKAKDLVRIKGLINNCGLPADARGIDFSDIYESHLHDKKFVHGVNRFVLPAGIGRARVVEGVPDSVVKQAIKKYLKTDD